MSAPAGPRAQVQALIAREPPGVDDQPGTVAWLRRLCRVLIHELPASGAGVSVMNDQGVHGTAAAADPVSGIVEELQFTLGEGPCLDAYNTRRPVLVSELADGASTRWPGYASAAHDQGVRAVFAFPLQIGAACLGVLDVYRDQPGQLSSEALAQALTFAEVALLALLEGQEVAGQDDNAELLDEALTNRPEIYQAQGMVQVQLGVGLTEAMARLRAHAYAHNRRLEDVARDVVARTLTLDGDNP